MNQNPTSEINIAFPDYVAERTLKQAKHLKGGVPDYAYSSDFALRQKLNAIPGFQPFFKAALQTNLSKYRQMLNYKTLRVTNRQYPKLYEIIHYCAETLGVGAPTLYVTNYDISSGELMYHINAAAYAFEDSDPLITITTAAVERLTDEELIAILGHECGHIHNNHVMYQTAVNYLVALASGGLTAKIQLLISQPLQMALYAWSRAAEVTADRAACICCANEDVVLSQKAKSLDNAAQGQEGYDIDEILKQYDELGSFAYFQEIMAANHPATVRRMLAQKEFFKSEVYYDWHPEQKKPGQRYYSKEELDARCDRYLSTLRNEKR